MLEMKGMYLKVARVQKWDRYCDEFLFARANKTEDYPKDRAMKSKSLTLPVLTVRSLAMHARIVVPL